MSDSLRILCLETSSQICSVAILDGDKITELKSEKIQNHAEVLMGMIHQCCEQAGVQLKELHAIALSDGPGSYTGLRIGSSTAKGICFALNLPLIAVNTLKALAWDALRSHTEALIWPMIDARRMEVYECVFDRQLNAVSEMHSGIITEPGFEPEFLKGQSVLVCGDGAKKTASHLSYKIYDNHPEAGFLCALARQAYTEGNFVDTALYEPFYLKSANITVSKR